MVYISFVLAFIASTLNSIIKSMICFFPCLKISIFHLISTVSLLLLNDVFIPLIVLNITTSEANSCTFLQTLSFSTNLLNPKSLHIKPIFYVYSFEKNINNKDCPKSKAKVVQLVLLLDKLLLLIILKN